MTDNIEIIGVREITQRTANFKPSFEGADGETIIRTLTVPGKNLTLDYPAAAIIVSCH